MSLDQTALQSLRPHFSGTLVTPDHAEYDEARQVWNAMIDRRPAAVARCRSADDVVAAVNWARERRRADCRAGRWSQRGRQGDV